MKTRILICILLVSAFTLGAETVIFQETVKGKTTRENIDITRITENGLSWEISTAKDSVSKIGTDENGKVQAMEVSSTEGNWTLKVDGDNLTSAGTYKGNAFSGTLPLKGRLWSSGFDMALKTYIRNNTKGNLPFLMVNPVDISKCTEMVLVPEKEETLDGKIARRFKITLEGAKSLFWSAKIWADPLTGDQVKYQGNQGPGTPDMVLVIERLP